MEQNVDLIRSTDIRTSAGVFTLTLTREDFSGTYPGMVRYTLRLVSDGQTVSVFRTNTYEYSPTVPLKAESVALQRADEWERNLRANPRDFAEYLAWRYRPRCMPIVPAADVMVVQGSPRADGNSSILAGWSAEAARDLGRTAQVLYLGDMDIRPCIGCYRCYNTGFCTFEDDLTGVIHAVKQAELLVICSPVYTNTVPGGLKIFIDRFQAYHAERTLTGGGPGPKGLLLSVAGRRGRANFRCVTAVIDAFMRNLGIEPAGEILVDGLDEIRDVRRIPGLEERVRAAVQACLAPSR